MILLCLSHETLNLKTTYRKTEAKLNLAEWGWGERQAAGIFPKRTPTPVIASHFLALIK